MKPLLQRIESKSKRSDERLSGVLTIFDTIRALVHLSQPFLALQVKFSLLRDVKRAIIILMNPLIILLVNLLDMLVVL